MASPLPEDTPVPPETVAPPPPDSAEPPLLPPSLAAGTATPPAPPAAGLETPRARQPFTFHGDTGEYFRIWIVNTLLTLLTLGLYSAWAKVRKRRYLRGSTELMGHRFDYLAEPKRILVGNILVVLMFIAYMVVGEVYPLVRFGALGIGLVLLPWVVVRSLAFNAHNTAYRGMRFRCRRTYGGAALLFLGQGVLIALSLGFYYPAWVRNRKRYVIEGHRLGDAFFRFESGAAPFYAAYLVSGAMIVGAVVLGGTITSLLIAYDSGHAPGLLHTLPFFIIYGFTLFCAKQYVYARLFNHIWGNTRLDQHRFSANLSMTAWFNLQLANLGLIIVSAGLLYPWAVVRSTRYTLSCLHFEPQGSIEKISRLGRTAGSAVGETAAEFVGLDFGL